MNWPVARKAALERAGHRCEKCGVETSANGRALHVHHRDGDRTNNAPSNLQVLCAKHHRWEHPRECPDYVAARAALDSLRLELKRSPLTYAQAAAAVGLTTGKFNAFIYGFKAAPAGFAQQVRSAIQSAELAA